MICWHKTTTKDEKFTSFNKTQTLFAHFKYIYRINFLK